MLSDPPSSLAIEDYVQRFVCNVVGTRGAAIEPSQTRSVFRELSRLVELENSVRDQWGNWDWQYCDSQRSGKLYVPWLDMPLASLRQQLKSLQPHWLWEPLWPENKPFALCLTHDVDAVADHTTWRTVLRPIQHSIRTKQSWLTTTRQTLSVVYELPFKSRLTDPGSLRDYADWLKLEDTYGFKSTFFIFPSRLSHPHQWDCTYQFHDLVRYHNRKMPVRDMMQAISESGWEIGLHGSCYSATEPHLLVEQRRQIEDVLGHAIISTRQHNLRYDRRITPRLQADAGLKLDSTQGFNRSVGFRAGTSFPYWCWDHQTEQPVSVLEIPQHIMDGGLFLPNSLEYDEQTAVRHSLQLMDRVEEVGGCLTLNWHANYLNDDKWWNVYKALLEEGCRRNAWGCSAKQLYEWWTARQQRILSSSSVDDDRQAAS